MAVAVLAGSIGYWFTGAVLLGIGLHAGFFVTFMALAVGVLFAIGAIYYKAPKGILIFFSAIGGASAIIGGILLLFGVVPMAVLGTGLVSYIIHQSFWWTLVWLALTVVGVATQLQLSRSIVIEESSYTSMYPTTMTGAKGGEASKKDKNSKRN